jgi:hypothetical protein
MTALAAAMVVVKADRDIHEPIDLVGAWHLPLGARWGLVADAWGLTVRRAAPGASFFDLGGARSDSWESGFGSGSTEWILDEPRPTAGTGLRILPAPAVTVVRVPTHQLWLLNFAVCPGGWTVEILFRPVLIVLVCLSAVLWISPARRRRGHCQACGYDLAGLAADAVCPECGAAPLLPLPPLPLAAHKKAEEAPGGASSA